MVEKRWRAACERDKSSIVEDDLKYNVVPSLPTDSEIAAAFIDRKQRFSFFLHFNSFFLNSLLNEV